MTGINELRKPRNDRERELDKIDSLVLSAQIAIQNEMHIRGVSQAELARRLGVTTARVSQIVGGSASNLTLKTIGRIAHALGEQFEVVAWKNAVEHASYKRTVAYDSNKVAGFAAARGNSWKYVPANKNRYPDSVSALAA